MNNQNSIDEYSNIFKSRRDNLESQKQQLQEDYIKELERLKQEQEEKIKKLEEKENLLYAFEQIDYENITVEDIEDLLLKTAELDLTDDELIIVMTRLTELSTLDLEKEIEEEVVIVEEPKPEVTLEKLYEEEVKEEKKQETTDYFKEYKEQYEEIEKTIIEYKLLIEDFKNKDNNISNLKKQIQKEHNNGLASEYYNIVGRINILKSGIESDGVSLIEPNNSNKKIIKSKEEELKSRFERIKEDVEKLKELLGLYNEVYERYRKELEDIIFEKLEEAKKVTEIIEDTYIDDLIEAREEIPQELEIEDEEPEEDIFDIEEEYPNIDEETLSNFGITYDSAILLYNNMKQSLEKGLIEEGSYLYQLYSTLELLIEFRPPKGSTEADIVTAINNLNKTIMTIEVTVDDDLKEVLFPTIDQEHINVGPKNIIIFLDNNEEYLIEKDLNDMVAGDERIAKKELQGALTKYTVRSWNTDLREKSHHLKGSKLKLGNDFSEARSCPCCTKKTRISLVPLSVNQEIKNKIKDTYNLTDEFENVFLVGGITKNHGVDEDLKPPINNNSKRIKEINDMFSNSNTNFSEIEAMINGSSELCEKLFGNEKVSKGVK